MSCFDILSNTTRLESRLFLEASAGTGKTFTIEHLVVRLLIETSISLDRLVVVTFTRAATRELKERIRHNLEQIAEGKGSYSYLQGISDLQDAKIREALTSFDSAQILTIHGFCSHLLKEFALEAGAGLKLSEWSEEEQQWEAKEFLRSQTTISSGQMRRLLGSFQNNIDRFIEAMLRAPDRTPPPSENLLQEVNTLLKNITPFAVAQEFEEARSSYKGTASEEFEGQAEELEEALTQRELSAKVWNRWITAPFFLKNLCPSQLKVRAKTGASERLSYLREIILPRLERAQNRDQIFLKLAGAWHLHRKKISQQSEKISPDDLLQLIHSKLSNPWFVQAVRKKYEAVIVDEFQDTDPLQWEIFKTIFLEDRTKSVYLVGDPKQSIYAFRSADIYTYLDAARCFDVGQKGALLHNFRSSSQLLSQMNRLLCNAPWMDLPKQGTYLEIPQAISANEGAGELCFMVAEGEKGRQGRWPTPDIEETLFFPFIVEEIQTHQLSPGQTAILVKDRYQAERVKKFLDSWRVPASLYRAPPLRDSPVLEFLEEVADACIEDFNSASIKKILLGPFIATPLSELTSERVFQAKQFFKKLKQTWFDQGFTTFFAQFLEGKELDPSLYEDLLEIIQKVGPSSHHPYQLKQRLAEIKQYETESRISTHSEGVQIMTIHASKGLEFETVFALGLASRTPASDLSEETLKELDAEKMRQFYVALTRAKKRLYIPIARELPTPSYALGEASPIELFLAKTAPDLSSFSQQFLNGRTFQLHQEEIHLKTGAPLMTKPAVLPRFIQSFSSLAQEASLPAKGETQGIQAGAQTGVIIHRILERYFNREGDLQQLISQEIGRTPLALQGATLYQMITQALELSLGTFCLKEISLDKVQTEMEFLYSTKDGWMKGYIDLCFQHEGRLYAVDWKTNLLENTDDSTILQLMQSHDYLLQGQIYTQALQKHLLHYSKITFGKVFFIFLRGPAVYTVSC